jgi:hypothetical protein
MRIKDLAHKDGRAGHWRSETTEYGRRCTDPPARQVREIWHYSTMMLRFSVDQPSDDRYLDYSTGHGSKSDQGGMNVLFRELGLPYYFSRMGGASIDRLSYEEVRVS